MDIQKKIDAFEIGNRYDTYLSIEPCERLKHGYVEIYMSDYGIDDYDGSSSSEVSKILEFEQLKELAAYLNKLIADIELKNSK